MFLLLTACTATPNLQSFRAQSCVVVYCESTENSKVKAAGLRLVKIALAVNGADLDLNRGFCEEYYTNRTLDYRYSVQTAEQVCHYE